MLTLISFRDMPDSYHPCVGFVSGEIALRCSSAFQRLRPSAQRRRVHQNANKTDVSTNRVVWMFRNGPRTKGPEQTMIVSCEA
jgi:hypothetical protein